MAAEKKIDKLTKEQEAKIPEYLEKYKAIGLCTRPSDMSKAVVAINESYAYQKMGVPEVIIVADPFEGARLAAQHAKGNATVTEAEVQDQATKASFGSFNAQWVVFYAFIAYELPVKRDNLIEIVDRIILEAGVYWTFEDLIIVSPKPSEIHMVDNKLHRTDGPALLYASGKGVYAVNGVRKASLMEVALEAEFVKTNKGTEAEEAS